MLDTQQLVNFTHSTRLLLVQAASTSVRMPLEQRRTSSSLRNSHEGTPPRLDTACERVVLTDETRRLSCASRAAKRAEAEPRRSRTALTKRTMQAM
jgi:hypothetical protein